MVELAGLLVSTPAKRVALTDTLNTSSTGQWTLLQPTMQCNVYTGPRIVLLNT